MKVLKLAIVLAAVTSAAACASKEEFDAHVAYVDGTLYPWLVQVGKAVCNLEVHTNPPNPGGNTRLCPSGPGGPGDQTTPPPPPPPKG